MPTFKELAILNAKKQPKQVEYVTEESPVLSNMPFEQGSHDLYNLYEEVIDITGPGFVDLDSQLPLMNVDSKLKQFDLSTFGGEVRVGEDKAKKYGGFAAYLAKNEAALMRKAGNQAEYAILYNALRAYAIAKGNKINAGGSSNINHCILAVRFVAGETTGIYSPLAFKNGVLLDFMPLSGGQLMKIKVTRNGAEEEINGYAGRYKSFFGLQIANPQSVAGIFNVDRISATKKLPTKDQIDDLLDMVRANGANTRLFMHPKIKSSLNTYKDTPLRMDVEDKRFDRRIDFWHDVPIVTSYNFLDGTETNVSFS